MPLPFLLEDLGEVNPRLLLTKTVHPGLVLMDLSSIQGSPGELVRATIAKLPELAAMADSIVLDTSPVGATAEVLELLPHVDSILVVARVGHTVISAARRTAAILRDVATAPIILIRSASSLRWM